MRAENLDPRQGWNVIAQKVALPDELAIFCWEDKFRLKSSAISTPTFIESSRKIFEGNEYDCDSYVCKIKNAAGIEAASLVYNVFYSEGKIFCVESLILRGGKLYPLNILRGIKIQSEIPPNTFNYLPVLGR